MEYLKKEFINFPEIVFLDEPINAWEKIKSANKNILQHFYEDKPKYALVMQLTALISRHASIATAVSNGAKYIIMERCLKTDSEVFAASLKESGFISDIEWQVYQLWNRQFLDEHPITGLIYFNTSPEDCLQNIKIRGRAGEENITLDLLETYDQFHKKYISNFNPQENVLTIDFNLAQNEKITLIKNFLCKNFPLWN